MSAKKRPVVLFCALVWCYNFALCASTTPTTPYDPSASFSNRCDSRLLLDAIQRIDQHLEAKVNVLRYDIGKVQIQGGDTQRAALDCRNNVERLMDKQNKTNKRNNKRYNNPYDPNQSRKELKEGANFDQKLEDLSRKVEWSVATLQSVPNELIAIKQYLSNIASVTNSIWDKIDMESNIQRIFKFTPDQSVSYLQKKPRNCQEIKQKLPNRTSGIYLVQPESSKPPFMVYCDMEVQNGGWLTIHSRFDGSQDFFLNWPEYKVGFGNIAGEHWLGLEKIYQLTGSEVNELLIELVDQQNRRFRRVTYKYFSIGSEEEGYPLKVLGGFRGNAADALAYHAGAKFSTKDKDQDSWLEGSCARSHSGAWWYKACDRSNLNGRYSPGPPKEHQITYQSMYWADPDDPQNGLQEARMLIRPREDSYS